MATEREVQQFLKMTIFQKARLQESDPQKYSELKKASDEMFPVVESVSGLEVSSKDGKKIFNLGN